MANEIQTAPNTTLTTNTDWENELNLRELSMKGYDGISLTEWAAGDTDKPQIAAGSVIEIDGAIAKFTNQTALTDEGGLADGWCYIKFVVSGTTVTPTLTNTFGTWDTAKQGFYTAGNRFSLHKMYRSGAVTKIFTQKANIINSNGFNNNAYFPDMGERTKTSALLVTDIYAVPQGIYYIQLSVAADNSTIVLECNTDIGWQIISRASRIDASGINWLYAGIMAISDGANLRINTLSSVSAGTYTLIKLG